MTDILKNKSLTSILALMDSPGMKVIRQLEESPINKILKEFENSPMNRAMKELENSPINRAMKEFENSPMNQMMKELENSPMNRTMKELENSPMNRMFKEFENSSMSRLLKEVENSKILNIFGAIENSNVMGGFSHVAEQLRNDCGSLIFTEAYKIFTHEYGEYFEEESIDELAENVKNRAENAPSGNLSSEFYLSQIIAFIFFYICYMSAIESEEKILNKIDGLEQIVKTQLHEIEQTSEKSNFLVADRSMNLRSGSGTEHSIIGSISRNQKLLELERNRDWVKVEYFDHIKNVNLVGWAHSRYLIQFTLCCD